MTRLRADLPVLAALLFLTGIGLVMVYSSSAITAATTLGDGAFYLKRQAFFAAVGVVALGFGASIDPMRFERHAYPILVAALFLLLLVLVPGIGHVAGGARRWLTCGPFSLQAGEPIKLALVVYLAMSLAKKGERMKTFSVGVLPHFLIPGCAMLLLLLEPDFGTAVMLATITFLMLFVGGARVGYLAGVFLLAVPVGLHILASSAYRMRRVLAFLDPWTHRYDIGYQITESLMTLGSGGFFGLGVGNGKQKLFFLPAAHTDFIFAVAGEELGFLGTAAVIGAFGVIAVRGVLAALESERPFLGYLALGLTATLVVQALFNIAVVLGLVPTKGITLPFVSYGGSSLVMSLLLGGILARVVVEAREPAAQRPSPRSPVTATRNAKELP